LTKTTSGGECYRRPAEIEAAIDAALSEDLEQLRARASVRSRSSVGTPLQSEVLVHLLRAAGRRGDQRALGALFPPLLARCEAILRRKVPDGDLPNAEEVREQILREFAVLLAEDSSELDFFECKFNQAFRALRIQYVRPARRSAKHIEDLPATDNEVETTEEDVLARLSEAYRSAPTQEEDVERSELRTELVKALNSLPIDQRETVLLVHLYDMKEESEDSNEMTAAKKCNVTGRTIRNRLAKARSALAKILKERS
jgi:RNA polymerase sigma factor (sigma-70 family)